MKPFYFYVPILLALLLPSIIGSEQKKREATIALINKTGAPIEIKTKFLNEQIFYGQIAPEKKFDISSSRHYADSPDYHVFVQYKNSGYGWQDMNLNEIKKQINKPRINIIIKPATLFGISLGLSCEAEAEQLDA